MYMDTYFYEINLDWKSERKGEASATGLPSLEVATPPEFPKGHPGIWSPEHLYVASASVCLMTTFLAVAENSKLEFAHFQCKAKGKLEKVEGKFMITEIILEPKVQIKDEKERDRTEKILHKSESSCLISNSMKTKVSLEKIQIEVI
jgi:peroxiredoxin-like protein